MVTLVPDRARRVPSPPAIIFSLTLPCRLKTQILHKNIKKKTPIMEKLRSIHACVDCTSNCSSSLLLAPLKRQVPPINNKLQINSNRFAHVLILDQPALIPGQARRCLLIPVLTFYLVLPSLKALKPTKDP